MTYDGDADAVVELELERLRLKQRRHGERTNGHLATHAIKMLIGDWHSGSVQILSHI